MVAGSHFPEYPLQSMRKICRRESESPSEGERPTTQVVTDVSRIACVKFTMSTMGRPLMPRSMFASITRAAVATTEVAAGRHSVSQRAGAKGIAATRGRLQFHISAIL